MPLIYTFIWTCLYELYLLRCLFLWKNLQQVSAGHKNIFSLKLGSIRHEILFYLLHLYVNHLTVGVTLVNINEHYPLKSVILYSIIQRKNIHLGIMYSKKKVHLTIYRYEGLPLERLYVTYFKKKLTNKALCMNAGFLLLLLLKHWNEIVSIDITNSI